jgi:hypothetical protein
VNPPRDLAQVVLRAAESGRDLLLVTVVAAACCWSVVLYDLDTVGTVVALHCVLVLLWVACLAHKMAVPARPGIGANAKRGLLLTANASFQQAAIGVAHSR